MSATMSREAIHRFLPATTVMLEKYVPGGIDYMFPDWVLKQCPTQFIELTVSIPSPPLPVVVERVSIVTRPAMAEFTVSLLFYDVKELST